MTPGEKVRLEKWHRPPTNEPPHKRGDVIERDGKFMEVVHCHRVPRPHLKDGQKTYTVGWRLELKSSDKYRCEYCGQHEKGYFTHRGFRRCKVCGEPGQ